MNVDAMTRLGKHARALAAALAIGATVLSLAVAPAYATDDTGVGGGKKCKLKWSDGSVEYKDEGSRYWDKFTGTWKTCKNGTWQRDGATETPAAPRPGGGVYAP